MATREELAGLPVDESREITVQRFAPAEQADPMLLDRSYSLEPISKSPKAYVLQTMRWADEVRQPVVEEDKGAEVISLMVALKKPA
ncbi:hypothetical protein ODE13_13630 [Nesterenkonia sp. HG001]|nr:hypothetical protein [Nesterenkonia sp. HG001]MDZ5078597.1 hypothetical protein [Nesterenkonia sp. HG001]